jgi:hypothetical protein
MRGRRPPAGSVGRGSVSGAAGAFAPVATVTGSDHAACADGACIAETARTAVAPHDVLVIDYDLARDDGLRIVGASRVARSRRP